MGIYGQLHGCTVSSWFEMMTNRTDCCGAGIFILMQFLYSFDSKGFAVLLLVRTM